MQRLGDIREHFWLTLAMAKHCEVDLAEAMRDGRISTADYADHITRCRACPSPEHCKYWLKNASAGDEPPQYCQNKASFAELTSEPA